MNEEMTKKLIASMSELMSPISAWTESSVKAACSATLPGLVGPDAEGHELKELNCSDFSELVTALHSSGAPCIEFCAAASLAALHGKPLAWHLGTRAEIDEASVGVVGDLHVQGDLNILNAALVVTGNLTVSGCLSDCGPDSRVVVMGNLNAMKVQTSGWMIVGGDAIVSDAVFGSYNDDSLEVHGTVRASAVITDEHSMVAKKGFQVTHVPEKKGPWGQEIFDVRTGAHVAQLNEIFADVWNKDGE